MRYRYILSGIVNTDESLSSYRLAGSNNICYSHSALRVNIPSDLKLDKLSCDSYSTTTDNRTIKELGYDVIIKINGKWVVRNDLKVVQTHEFNSKLIEEGMYTTNNKDGYMTKNRYNRYINKHTNK